MSDLALEEDIRRKVDLGLWKQVFRYALRHKRLLYPLAVLAVALSAVETLFPLVTKVAVDVAHAGGGLESLKGPGLAYAALAFALGAGVYLFVRCAGGIARHISHDIRGDGFRRLQELEFAYYDAQPAGWLIARLTSDCDRLSNVIAWGFLDLLWSFCFVVAMAVAMLLLDWRLALVVLCVAPPLVAVSVYFQKRLLYASRETRRHNARITASYNEGIAGVKTTKTLGREAENLAEFAGQSGDMYEASVRRAKIGAVYMPIVMTIGSVGSGLAIWHGGLSSLEGTITVGALIAFVSYTGQFFMPINQMAMVLTELQGAQAAGERVLNLLKASPKIKDSDEVRQRLARFGAAPGGDAETAPDGHPARIESVEFRRVSFAYAESEPILRDFSLKAFRGQSVALVGPSGGGKSTIVSLLARFYEPTAGEILVNGLDYRKRGLAWYQAQLGVVLQTPHLFSGSVRENIRYGRLDATDEQVERAARLAGADRFVEKLERGYDTVIGEAGARLSTGERQLVSFARALLADPQIFIMDEATSSIDTETEKLIQAGLQTMLQGRISFLIAHRLSTIRNADQILVIDKGRIAERGSHEELLARRGRYCRLYVGQFQRESVTEELGTGLERSKNLKL